MSLAKEIEAEIQKHEQIIDDMERKHADRMKDARQQLAILKRLLMKVEGNEQ